MKQQIDTGELRNPSVAATVERCKIEIEVSLRGKLQEAIDGIPANIREAVEAMLKKAKITLTDEKDAPRLLISISAKSFPLEIPSIRATVTGVRVSIRLDEAVICRRGDNGAQVLATTWNSGATMALRAGELSSEEIERQVRSVLDEQMGLFLEDRTRGLSKL